MLWVECVTGCLLRNKHFEICHIQAAMLITVTDLLCYFRHVEMNDYLSFVRFRLIVKTALAKNTTDKFIRILPDHLSVFRPNHLGDNCIPNCHLEK